MKSRDINLLPMRAARLAGLLYLVIAVFGAFAIAYVPSQIVAPGDAEATARNLSASPGLFRAGILADVVVILAEIVITALLFVILKPVNSVLSLVAAMARYGMIMVMTVNLMLNIAAFMISRGALDGSPQTMLALFTMHAQGVYLWGILFGLHLLVLGTLVFRSGYLPRALGAMMVAGSFGYTIEGIARVTGTEIAALNLLIIALLAVVTAGELAFALWLLVRGLDRDGFRAAAA